MAKSATGDRAKKIAAFEKGIIGVDEAEPYIKALVYGRNGHGKTRFAATAPKPIIFDINEKGTHSVRDYPDVQVRHIKKWEDLTFGYWYLREGNHDRQSVVLDTMTMAQIMCMKHVLREQEDRDPNRPPSMPDRQSWGKMGELLKPLILNFRNLDMNVIFVCQERVYTNEDGDEVSIEHVPELSPSVRGVLTGSVGLIGRVYQKGVRKASKKGKETVEWQTRMLVGPHDEFITKNRLTPHMGRILVNPTVPEIIEGMKTTNQED